MNKNIIYEFLLLVVPLFVFFFVILVVVAKPFEVSGDSMYPTLKNGEKIFAQNVSYNFGDKIARGDIVVVQHPEYKESFLVKRVIALPEDSIEFSNGVIYINGIVIDENYLPEGTKTLAYGNFEADTVYNIPADKYLVLGDNRDSSSDSRAFGYFDINKIEGKVYTVYLPLNSIRIL